ncbi:MAG: hypothetical protein ACXVZO_09430 [Gaiellaceae bacterium]
MHLRNKCALGVAVASIAALAPVAPAQAQPAVCSTAAFRAIDRSISRNPQPFARLLSFAYRFAPAASLAEFDTLAQCDPGTASAVYKVFATDNRREASSFQQAFASRYPNDAYVVGVVGTIIG